jgi:hypothetical protein
MVTIRRCTRADLGDVLAFLETHWKPGHVFARHPALFEWQYALPDTAGEFSMAIARHDTDGSVAGVLGYLPTRRFDPDVAAHNTVWLALWKVRDDVTTGAVGLKLLRFVLDAETYVASGVIQFHAAVRPIYEAFGYTIGELRHFVMANPDIDVPVLAVNLPRPRPVRFDSSVTSSAAVVESFSTETHELDSAERRAQTPRKTATHILQRYLRHPFYEYDCRIMRRHNRPIALLVTRVADHDGHRALRIVDYLGPAAAVGAIGPTVLESLRRTGAEYADVYNFGIDPAHFEAAGFTAVDPEGKTIVPDHFEPFERRNVRIPFAIKSEEPVVLFKGDGDQDRPNQVTA